MCSACAGDYEEPEMDQDELTKPIPRFRGVKMLAVWAVLLIFCCSVWRLVLRFFV